MVPSERDIARLAARQWGVVGREQLRQLRLSERAIDGRIARGILFPLFRGVYAYGNPNVTDHALLFAAQLSCGDAAFFSHETAAAILGLRRLYRGAIEVTVPRGGGRSRSDLILHRTRTADRREVTTRNGLRVSTFARLLVDLAPDATPARLEELITFGVRNQLYVPDAVEATLERHAHSPGVALPKAAVARYRPGPDRKSELERSFDAWKLTRPDIPDPERNVHLDIWEIDCLWREQAVALELDGRPYHVAVQDFDKDSRKNNDLLVMGLRPMRVSDFRWEHDHARVVADLEALLEIRPLRG